jgi:hypothetical protein
MADKKHDGQRNTGGIHLAVQVQSVHSGHANVQDHATLGFHWLKGKKFQKIVLLVALPCVARPSRRRCVDTFRHLCMCRQCELK